LNEKFRKVPGGPRLGREVAPRPERLAEVLPAAGRGGPVAVAVGGQAL